MRRNRSDRPPSTVVDFQAYVREHRREGTSAPAAAAPWPGHRRGVSGTVAHRRRMLRHLTTLARSRRSDAG